MFLQRVDRTRLELVLEAAGGDVGVAHARGAVVRRRAQQHRLGPAVVGAAVAPLPRLLSVAVQQLAVPFRLVARRTAGGADLLVLARRARERRAALTRPSLLDRRLQRLHHRRAHLLRQPAVRLGLRADRLLHGRPATLHAGVLQRARERTRGPATEQTAPPFDPAAASAAALPASRRRARRVWLASDPLRQALQTLDVLLLDLSELLVILEHVSVVG